MLSLRKLVCRPKVDDWAPLAKFYYADENLNAVAAELDSFDATKDPDKNQQLINQLRHCQDRVIQIIEEIMQDAFPNEGDRTRRDYRVKFPDDILHDGLPGQLWFGAECLSAGTNIVDRIGESDAIRPLAKKLTSHLDSLRDVLKEQSLRDPCFYTDKIKNALRVFDALFAEFELNYVSIMVPVKSVREYDLLQDVCALFSETLIRAIHRKHIDQDMIDMCDPSVMITLPRLAIVCGLLIYPDGPLNIDRPVEYLPDMFQSFRTLLRKIRELLRALTDEELTALERALSNQEQLSTDKDKVALMSEFQCSKKLSAGGTGHVGGPSASFYKTQMPPIITTTTTTTTTMTTFGKDSPSAVEKALDDKIVGGESLASIKRRHSFDSAMKNDQERNNAQAKEAIFEKFNNTCTIGTEIKTDCRSISMNAKARTLRSRFWSPEDMVHRLFVCISGVADQLQSNYPADLRAVLKSVLNPHPSVPVYEISGRLANTQAREEETGLEAVPVVLQNDRSNEAAPSRQDQQDTQCLPTPWVPDSECPFCYGCQRNFTFTFRRHHCRHCGRVFCYRCSANSLPLPRFGFDKPVRVCNRCYFYELDPFLPNQRR